VIPATADERAADEHPDPSVPAPLPVLDVHDRRGADGEVLASSRVSRTHFGLFDNAFAWCPVRSSACAVPAASSVARSAAVVTIHLRLTVSVG
jgi:hypothetical protein